MGGNSTATSNAFSAGSYIGPASTSGMAGGGEFGSIPEGVAVNNSDLIPSLIGTNSAAGGGGMTSYVRGTSWEEFCERHARAAAADFAKACINFINGNLLPEEARNVTHRSFSGKFSDTFADHFENEFIRRRNNSKTGNGTLEECDYAVEHDSPKIFHKAFFRRLSFKGLRKGKNFLFLQTLFHKSSDDADGTGSSKQNKTRLSRIIVECRKEGVVNNLTPESLDQPATTQKWEKCRLALVKAVGGYMLEFYTPPKSEKPCRGVFCFLISEARETTALEMPDRENTFVLKADNNMEYVIEANNAEDMLSWLATIRYCMRTPPTQQPTIDTNVIASAAMQTSPVTINPSGSTSGINAVQNPQYQQHVSGSNGNIGPSSSLSESALATAAAQTLVADANADTCNINYTSTVSAPDIPPRSRAATGERGEQRLSASSNFDANDFDTEPDINVADLTAEMRQYPWFHGTLPRSEAARMVLHSEAAGHGFFLVRQSETRKGEFVLTFNFQGRAKHLRMTLSEKGQCRVQHLWFPSIQEMLEHFRHNPIPLESGGSSDVTLTLWVHNQGVPYNDAIIAANGAGDAQQQQQQPSPRHQEVITMNLSVRLKTCEIELPFTTTAPTAASALAAQHHQHQQQQSSFHLNTHSSTMTLQQQAMPSPTNIIQQQQQQQQQLRASTISLQSQTAAASAIHHQQHHHFVDAHTPTATHESGRAVDNQYSFV